MRLFWWLAAFGSLVGTMLGIGALVAAIGSKDPVTLALVAVAISVCPLCLAISAGQAES